MKVHAKEKTDKAKANRALRKPYPVPPANIQNDVSLYQCESCQQKFLSKEDIMEHMKIHAEKQNLHCGVCEFEGSTEAELLNHVISHAITDPNEECNYIVIVEGDDNQETS